MTVFYVDDMTCGHCESTVKQAPHEALPGACGHRLGRPYVAVQGDADMAETAIRDAGYTPEKRA